MTENLRKRVLHPPVVPVMSQSTSSSQGPSASSSRPGICFDPLPWSDYFDSKEDLEVGEEFYRVYLAGKANCEDPKVPPLVVLLIHGAGFSGLTWALMVKELKINVQAVFVAIDLRDHGSSFILREHQLSFDTLASDLSNIYQELVTQKHVPENANVFVVGHSMGGALAAYVASPTANKTPIPRIVGTCVIDVVEGSAMEALSGMRSILNSRPKNFKSQQEAVEWALRSGYIKNRESARVSMMGQIQRSRAPTKPCHPILIIPKDDPCLRRISNDLVEVPEEEDGADPADQAQGDCSSPEIVFTPRAPPPRKPYDPDDFKYDDDVFWWRVDLFQTEHLWRSWFTGLTDNFLSFSGPKLLLLAGVDRLDKPLTVAQMQGKFQMQILPKAGHAIQEDAPVKVADALAMFIKRNRLAPVNSDGFAPVMPGC